MIDWVKALQEVETEDIKPLQTLSPEINYFDQDEPSSSLPLKKALSVAPCHDGLYFHVPKKELKN